MLSLRTATWLAGRLWKPLLILAAESMRSSRRRARR
jgi:hypothetical protein